MLFRSPPSYILKLWSYYFCYAANRHKSRQTEKHTISVMQPTDIRAGRQRNKYKLDHINFAVDGASSHPLFMSQWYTTVLNIQGSQSVLLPPAAGCAWWRSLTETTNECKLPLIFNSIWGLLWYRIYSETDFKPKSPELFVHTLIP